MKLRDAAWAWVVKDVSGKDAANLDRSVMAVPTSDRKAHPEFGSQQCRRFTKILRFQGGLSDKLGEMHPAVLRAEALFPGTKQIYLSLLWPVLLQCGDTQRPLFDHPARLWADFVPLFGAQDFLQPGASLGLSETGIRKLGDGVLACVAGTSDPMTAPLASTVRAVDDLAMYLEALALLLLNSPAYCGVDHRSLFAQAYAGCLIARLATCHPAFADREFSRRFAAFTEAHFGVHVRRETPPSNPPGSLGVALTGLIMASRHWQNRLGAPRARAWQDPGRARDAESKDRRAGAH